MVHATSHARHWISAAALIVLALAATRAAASESHGIGFGREGSAPNRCATTHATNPDALPGSEDPAALMRTLRQRGLVATDSSLRARGAAGGSIARGTDSGSLRCHTLGPGVVFRGVPLDRHSNRN
jgi:hypothetical protein